ncbi:MAG: ATP synthase F1 subunit epsilon [Bacilli bacterium]|nr:ATP synthase F1 subunit epsilon [Bacilli bacterium]
MKTMHLIVRTPYSIYLEVDVEFLSVKSSEFVLGILPNHAPLVTTLDICELKLLLNNKSVSYAIGGGVMNITKNHEIHLMLNSIERYDEIDINRANESKERALKRLEQKQDIDIARAEASLSRALNRINVFTNNNH